MARAVSSTEEAGAAGDSLLTSPMQQGTVGALPYIRGVSSSMTSGSLRAHLGTAQLLAHLCSAILFRHYSPVRKSHPSQQVTLSMPRAASYPRLGSGVVIWGPHHLQRIAAGNRPLHPPERLLEGCGNGFTSPIATDAVA